MVDKNAKMNNQKEHDVALDMWSRGFRDIRKDCGSCYILIENGIDIDVAQQILDENYDSWTENMHYSFEQDSHLQNFMKEVFGK